MCKSSCLFTLLLLLGLLSSSTVVNGRSNGAPTCINNRAAPGQEHKPTGFEQRKLGDNGLTLTIGGQTPVPGVPFGVPLNTPVAVKLSTRTSFKGMMVRLSGGDQDVDTSGVFVFRDGETDLKPNAWCDADIGGITHTNALEKQSFEWIMTFTDFATNMLLDVNVVESKEPVSRFYYDQYVLTTGADAVGITDPPTMAPDGGRINTIPIANTSGATMASMTLWIVMMGAAAMATAGWSLL